MADDIGLPPVDDPAGWRGSPNNPGQEEYWDGHAWTGALRGARNSGNVEGVPDSNEFSADGASSIAPATGVAGSAKSVPAGWYEDGADARKRYWDGAGWTDQYEEPAKPKVIRKVSLSALLWTGAGALILGLIIGGAAGGLAKRSTEPTAAAKNDAAAAAEKPPEEPRKPTAAPGTTLANPLPAGFPTGLSVSGGGEYSISFGPAVWNANQAVAAENQFNDAPDAGKQHLMVPVTVTNTGQTPIDPGSVTYSGLTIVVDGSTYSQVGFAVLPQALSRLDSVAPGTSATGNLAFMVPAGAAAGTWVITAGSQAQFVTAG